MQFQIILRPLILTAGLLTQIVASQVFAGGISTGCRAPHYRLVTLPLRPSAINDSGEIAGRTKAHRAAVWTQAKGLSVLPIPSGYSDSEAVAINRRGHLLGNLYDRANGESAPFFWASDKLVVLPGDHARGYAMNDADVLVGSAVPPGSTKTELVRWSQGAPQFIDSCCGGALVAENAGGVAIGNSYDDQGQYHAVRWTRSAGLQPIGPAGRLSTAIAMNAPGHVVLQAFTEVFMYVDGTMNRLSLSPKFNSKPLAISDCDVIVGAYGPYSDADRAFVWDRTAGFEDLNDLVDSNLGWTLESATGINSHGVIIGTGDFRGEENAGFMLLPVP